MKEALIIEATKLTPAVHLNPINGNFVIKGNSICDDQHHFYDPILEWLKQYDPTQNDITFFEFQIGMHNTVTKSVFYDIFNIIESLNRNNLDNQIYVKWLYHEDDEDMIELAEEFEDYFDHIPFQTIDYK